jgi:hypothetical protein
MGGVLLEIRLREGSRSRMCEILALQCFGDMFWPIRAVARIPDISKWDEVDGRDVGAEWLWSSAGDSDGRLQPVYHELYHVSQHSTACPLS